MLQYNKNEVSIFAGVCITCVCTCVYVCVYVCYRKRERGVFQEMRKLRNINFIKLNRSDIIYLYIKIEYVQKSKIFFSKEKNIVK